MTFDRNDCEDIVRRLWPYLDGRLADGEREWVAVHLAACEECASHFGFARAFLDALHASRSEAANTADTAALRERVLAALAAEGFGG